MGFLELRDEWGSLMNLDEAKINIGEYLPYTMVIFT